ncbi:hypothetical protein DFH07DRAFT_773572 [Mycena maculata]|uniref:Uncharacterized protein n=1 Tax=Mycena maculata TaxID=230809 RepID=A0AAD7NCI8_9AGAR|nr:hypothetical protein DFH07DRAFT_773572 [Mycena maculata]
MSANASKDIDAKPSLVDRLKAEGNAFHGKENYQAAYQKYSEAIEQNPDADKAILAVLYANRAASCLAMKEYMDAMHDGRKATKLDPTYAKAWARIGAAARALEMWDVCREAWTSGLACLPAQDLTPAELVLKAQYEAGLKAADAGEAQEKSGMEKGKYTHIGRSSWQYALGSGIQIGLQKSTCQRRFTEQFKGFVILNAYRVWLLSLATSILILVQDFSRGALTDITNGLIRDTRVFHARGNFLEQLQAQMRFEAEFAGAWGSGGPKQIQKEAPERLKKSGWLPVRRALSVTVRVWMLRAFVDGNMGVITAGVEFYKRILDVLDWGRRTWPNVSVQVSQPSHRGSIIPQARPRERIHPGGYCTWNLDPGFYASFWIYPIAEALTILGAYHMQLGLARIDQHILKRFPVKGQVTSDPQAIIDFSHSAQYYQQAAEKFPEDDEHRAYFLAVALQALWWSEASLRITLPLCRKIRVATSKSVRIWEFSQNALTKRNHNCDEAVRFLADCERKLAAGEATLESALMPSDLLERRAAKIAYQQAY